MALAVLLDAIGEAPETPVFPAGDLAALVLDHIDEGVGQGLHLGGGDVLTHDEYAFVKRHSFLPLACLNPRPYIGGHQRA